MQQVTVVIPNYNGKQYLKSCLESLEQQTCEPSEIILVDNGSEDGSCDYIKAEFPGVHVVMLKENTGFCHAVNVGIQKAETPYVLLLNNDTEVKPDFIEQMVQGMERHPRAFSGAAQMLQFQERSKIDDAGNYYNALGWAFARGKGKAATGYEKEQRIFASCGGAAIYRKEILDQIGLFDELHFAYLEDIDIGYRGRIYGYENWYLPKAVVYHVGSGTSGSRYNLFKIRYSSRNNVYMIYKNMPILQLILNFPLLVLGFAAKIVFFASKGYGKEYVAGIKNGISLSLEGKREGKKVKFSVKNTGSYLKIQWELWVNVVRKLCG
ncbi:MAG: glycosyltransferase family 2 protein [Lachnospiraceae bacterium]|nr:glycosyltransferase family 2 protein [Lachnospiraceae bacterium]